MGTALPIENIRVLLLKAAKTCGSQAAFAKKIGINRHHYNQYINGTEDVPLQHAINIQAVTNGKVRVKDIMAIKYKGSTEYKQAIDNIESWSRKAENNTEYIVPVGTIKAAENKLINPINISSYYLYRPVILDDINNNSFKLVGGFRTFYLQKDFGCKSINTRLFDFTAILKNNPEKLQKIIAENDFLISERTEIGLYIEGLIGRRQGARTDLKKNNQLVQNSAQVKLTGKTRNFLSEILNFGSHYSYCEAKKIISSDSNLLIEAVDRQILSISKAAAIIKLSQEEQFEIIEQTIQKKKLAIEPEIFNHWRFLCQ